jgi:hypothetical protein
MAIFKGSLKAIKEDWKSAVKYVIAGAIGFSAWFIVGSLIGAYEYCTALEIMAGCGKYWWWGQLGFMGGTGVVGGGVLGAISRKIKTTLKFAIASGLGYAVGLWGLLILFWTLGHSLRSVEISWSSGQILSTISFLIFIAAWGGILGAVLGAVTKIKKNVLTLGILGAIGFILEFSSGAMFKLQSEMMAIFLPSMVVSGAFLGFGVYLIESGPSRGEKRHE